MNLPTVFSGAQPSGPLRPAAGWARALAAIAMAAGATLAQAQTLSGVAATVGTQRPPNIAYYEVTSDGRHGATYAEASYSWQRNNPCPSCPISPDPDDPPHRWYRGEAWVSAALSGPTGLPVLKGYAQGYLDSGYGNDMFGVWTQADALQLYTYQGPATTLQLQLDLNALFAGQDAGWAGAYLDVMIFALDQTWWDAGGPADGNIDWLRHTSLGTLGEVGWIGGGSLYAGYDQAADSTLVSFDVDHGDQVVVYARLSVGGDAMDGNSGFTVDSRHTARMNFLDATGLTPQLMAPIPEPGSAALWLAGLAMMGGWVARRRSGATRA